jgi:hypothetical protein
VDCPQCGTFNREDAIYCHNCHASLHEEGELKEKPAPAKGNISLVMSIASLGIGLLSFLPYLYMVSRVYFPISRQKPYLHAAFDLGCLGGLPLGLAGIVLGILAWRRARKNRTVVTMAIIGILLGLGGIAGHLWFFLTCQFCQ